MTTSTTDYGDADLMTIVLGREIKDRDVIHCGAFTPLVLCSGMWAMAHHAPEAVMLPISLTASRIFHPFPLSYSLLEGMTLENSVQYPMVDIFTHVEGVDGCQYEPVNPLQVDRTGNINLSVIGDFTKPQIRGPGAAGVDILTLMLHDKLIIYVPRHSPRVLVEKVDFVTGAGNEPKRRRQAGASTGGISKVVTNLGVLEPGKDGILELTKVHPGVEVDDVLSATGFTPPVSEHLSITQPPTEDELNDLERIDPLAIRRFDFMTAAQRRAALPDLLTREYEYFYNLT